jgi:hypothetical protein
MVPSDRVERPLHPQRVHGVKLIVVMRGIGGGYLAGAANAPISQRWRPTLRLMQVKSAEFPLSSMACA